MIVIFVHGWSVRHTDTYGDLPRWLAQQGTINQVPIQVGNVYLGKYVSFDDAVTMDDLGRAFDQAVHDELDGKLKKGEKFACITHSTGGPVVRTWVDLHYRDKLSRCPLSHLIMLAPANHGSALAQLGRSRLSRIKFFFEGVEPGERILDWLELGSEQDWTLNERWLGYECIDSGIYPFVLTGQRIDRKCYDALNSYTGEPGSDGVVRVAAANMNYSLVRLRQHAKGIEVARTRTSENTAFGILPGCSHSGERMGIIRSVTPANADKHVTAHWVLRCLNVSTAAAYRRVAGELEELSAETQTAERVEKDRTLLRTRVYSTSRYSMIIFRVVDDRGQSLTDYDLYLTAGPDYSDDVLPPGFFVDRQRNRRNLGKLTYFVDYDVMHKGLASARMGGNLGFRVVPRPGDGLAFYKPLDFRSRLANIEQLLKPNETLMVEIELQRLVDVAVFRLTNDLTPGPIDGQPQNRTVGVQSQ